MRLLIVNHEEDIAATAAKRLRKCGFAVDITLDGTQGDELLRIYDYDLVILDANLRDVSGIEICGRLRTQGYQTPVLMIASCPQPRERVAALNGGADDCISKPFDFDELVARVQALLRRGTGRRCTILKLGELRLDIVGRAAYIGDTAIYLTPKEFSILEYLMSHSGEVIDSQQLLEHAWDAQADSFSNAVRVHMAALRKKLRDDPKNPRYIETIAGHGYKMRLPMCG